MIPFGPLQWTIAAVAFVVAVAGCVRLTARGLKEWRAGFFVCALAVGASCLGVAELWSSWRLTRGARAVGEVVEMKYSTRKDKDDNVVYARSPVVRFRARETEQEVEFTALGYSSGRLAEGDRVELFYPPGHPEQARLDDFGDLWFRGIMWTIVGLPGILAGMIALVYVRWQRARVRATDPRRG